MLLVRKFLAIDLGGTNTKCGIVTQAGEILESKKFKTNADASYDSWLREIDEQTLQMRANHQISGAGIGAPNINQSGILTSPPNFAWDQVNLIKDLENIFKEKVIGDNDANIAAISEKFFGHASELTDFIVLTLGTGLGSGVFLNEFIYRGHNGYAGEAGHIPVEYNGRPCGCGAKGHAENYVNVRGIEQTYYDTSGNNLSFNEIKDLYLTQNQDAVNTISKTAHYLGFVMATLQSTLNPQSFFISGGIATLGDNFVQESLSIARELTFSNFKSSLNLSISGVDFTKGALQGAAGLFLLK